MRLRALFSIRYSPAFYGARLAAQKAVLVPTAERESSLGLSIFPPVFRGVRAVMYNSFEDGRSSPRSQPTHTYPVWWSDRFAGSGRGRS